MKYFARVAEFLRACEIECQYSPHTLKAYKSDLAHFTRFLDNQTAENPIDVLKAYLVHMHAQEMLSVSTLRRRIATLKSYAKFVNEREAWENPFESWKPLLKPPKRLPKILPKTSVKRLVRVDESEQDIFRETAIAVMLISGTGVRVSELCAIDCADIEPDASRIRIRGKGSKDRFVYLTNGSLRALIERKLGTNSSLHPQTAFFLNSRGNRLSPQTFRRRLREWAGECGLSERVTPHMLRHSAATLLIEAGVNLRFVQRLLGHASISTTELYTHVSDVSLKDALVKADTVGNLLDDFAA